MKLAFFMSTLEVNDLLCYVSTALSSIDVDTIILNCLAFYGPAKVKEAKQRLAVILNEEVKWRRGDDRNRSDLLDIIDLIKTANLKGDVLPKFVAAAYNSMPPTSGFDLISETLLNLNDEIFKLKEEIAYLRDSRVSELNFNGELLRIKELMHVMNKDYNEIKLSCSKMEDKLNKLPNTANVDFDISNDDKILLSPVVPSAPSASQVFDLVDINRSPLALENPNVAGTSNCNWSDIVKRNSSQVHLNNVNIKRLNMKKNKPSPKTTKKTGSDLINSSKPFINSSNFNNGNSVSQDGFTLVTKSRKRNIGIFGNKITNDLSKFKSAKNNVDLYIGRCDLEVTENDISDYLKSELNIDEFRITELNSKNVNAKSFKINLEFSLRDRLLSEDAWPRGIICRKFYTGLKKQ